VGALLLVPLVFLRLWALSIVPIVSSRNLLILTGPLCLALALGVVWLARSRPGKVLVCLAAVCLLVAAAQYESIIQPLGGQGYPLGIHTGPWRDLAREVRAGKRPEEPLVAVQAGSTDPVLYYLSDCHPVRIADPGDLKDPGSRLRLVHVTTDNKSAELLDSFKKSGYSITLLWQGDTLLLYELRDPAL
jgi:hypothetical protein